MNPRTQTCLVLAVVWATGASADQLTLKRALDLAEDRNLTVRQAAAAVDGEQALLSVARAQRWPTLDVYQRYTRLDSRTVDRANEVSEGLGELIGIELPPFAYRDNHRTEIVTRFPLWTSGAISAGVVGQRELLTAATAARDASVRGVHSQTASLYFAVAAGDEVLRALRSATERAERRLSESERRVEVGLATRQEVLRWRVEVEAARAEEAAAEADLLVFQLELAALLQVDLDAVRDPHVPREGVIEDLLTWADELDPDEVLEATAPSLERLPDVQAARARAAAARQEVRATRAGLYPRVDGAFTYGWFENDTLALDEFADWSAALVLTIPIDLRGDVRGASRAAAAGVVGLEASAAEALTTVQLELGRNLAELQRVRTKLRSARRALTEASARRELLARQREVGFAGLLDLIDADNTLVASDVALAVARAEFLGAVARLELVWPDADPPNGGLIP
jgi:outer membrane protein TolC